MSPLPRDNKNRNISSINYLQEPKVGYRIAKYLGGFGLVGLASDRIGSAGESILGRVNDSTTLALSIIGVATGAVTNLLSGGLISAWLDGTSNLVSSTRYVLREDLSGGLLGLRSDLLAGLLAETLAQVVRHFD